MCRIPGSPLPPQSRPGSDLLFTYIPPPQPLSALGVKPLSALGVKPLSALGVKPLSALGVKGQCSCVGFVVSASHAVALWLLLCGCCCVPATLFSQHRRLLTGHYIVKNMVRDIVKNIVKNKSIFFT